MKPKYYVSKSDFDAPNQISEGEPCFVIRATDKYAPDIVALYYQLITHPLTGIHEFQMGKEERSRFLAEIAAHLARIHQWQADNPDKVKRPD